MADFETNPSLHGVTRSDYDAMNAYLVNQVGVKDLESWGSQELVHLAYQVAHEIRGMCVQLKLEPSVPPASLWFDHIRTQDAFRSVVSITAQNMQSGIEGADARGEARRTRHAGVSGAMAIAEAYLDRPDAHEYLPEGEALIQFTHQRGEKRYWAMRHAVYNTQTGELDLDRSGLVVYNVSRDGAYTPVVLTAKDGRARAGRLALELEAVAHALLEEHLSYRQPDPARGKVRVVANIPIGFRKGRVEEETPDTSQPSPTPGAIAATIVSGSVSVPQAPSVPGKREFGGASAIRLRDEPVFNEQASSHEKFTTTILPFPQPDDPVFAEYREELQGFELDGVFPMRLRLHYYEGKVILFLEYPPEARHKLAHELTSEIAEYYLRALNSPDIADLYNQTIYLLNHNFNGWQERFLASLRNLEITDPPSFPIPYRSDGIIPLERMKLVVAEEGMHVTDNWFQPVLFHGPAIPLRLFDIEHDGGDQVLRTGPYAGDTVILETGALATGRAYRGGRHQRNLYS